MMHRPSLDFPSSSFNRREKAFGDSLESLHTCCAQAYSAARRGLYGAAHHAFQDALLFFDRARGFNCGEGDELHFWPNTWQLMSARRQLDKCAALIYTNQATAGSRPYLSSAESSGIGSSKERLDWSTFSLQLPDIELLEMPVIKLAPKPAPLLEAERNTLGSFLEAVADSALKVKILGLFLDNSGICLSSSAVAERVGSSHCETRLAVQQLADCGALNYCSHFAFADLCHLSLPWLPEPMQLELRVLSMALRRQPELVWDSFDANGEFAGKTETE